MESQTIKATQNYEKQENRTDEDINEKVSSAAVDKDNSSSASKGLYGVQELSERSYKKTLNESSKLEQTLEPQLDKPTFGETFMLGLKKGNIPLSITHSDDKSETILVTADSIGQSVIDILDSGEVFTLQGNTRQNTERELVDALQIMQKNLDNTQTDLESKTKMHMILLFTEAGTSAFEELFNQMSKLNEKNSISIKPPENIIKILVKDTAATDTAYFIFNVDDLEYIPTNIKELKRIDIGIGNVSQQDTRIGGGAGLTIGVGSPDFSNNTNTKSIDGATTFDLPLTDFTFKVRDCRVESIPERVDCNELKTWYNKYVEYRKDYSVSLELTKTNNEINITLISEEESLTATNAPTSAIRKFALDKPPKSFSTTLTPFDFKIKECRTDTSHAPVNCKQIKNMLNDTDSFSLEVRYNTNGKPQIIMGDIVGALKS
jgi:hypothetical protein